MRRLRFLVVLLILWLLFFFSIERFSAPVNISRVAYPFAPLMAIFVILVPGVRRTPSRCIRRFPTFRCRT